MRFWCSASPSSGVMRNVVRPYRSSPKGSYLATRAPHRITPAGNRGAPIPVPSRSIDGTGYAFSQARTTTSSRVLGDAQCAGGDREVRPAAGGELEHAAGADSAVRAFGVRALLRGDPRVADGLH